MARIPVCLRWDDVEAGEREGGGREKVMWKGLKKDGVSLGGCAHRPRVTTD